MKIAHVINPVKAGRERDLYHAQPITFETMRRARKFSKKRKIELFAAFYPEDEEIVPDYFIKLPCLQESTLDWDFRVSRKLPFFREILSAACDATDADYIIQTNCDIGVLPHFYELVYSLIKKGSESLIINKRIIKGFYKSVEDINEMCCEIGTPHNGYDCFVFPRDLYPVFEIGDVCMGTPWSEATLAASMAVFSGLTVLREAHVTFHIGDPRTWLAPELMDYRQHNAEEFAKVVMKLADKWVGSKVVLKNPIVRWMAYKMKYELQPSWSRECHELCKLTTALR
jgi:hypothetical protein